MYDVFKNVTEEKERERGIVICFVLVVVVEVVAIRQAS
jgi:hypothetical protein